MCAHWEEGFCECEESPYFNADGPDFGSTCPCWTEIEILDVCHTCAFWIMYRRGRVCCNAEVSSYGLPMKPEEACEGWREKTSMQSPLRRKPS
jgi:hypothetical protein